MINAVKNDDNTAHLTLLVALPSKLFAKMLQNDCTPTTIYGECIVKQVERIPNIIHGINYYFVLWIIMTAIPSESNQTIWSAEHGLAKVAGKWVGTEPFNWQLNNEIGFSASLFSRRARFFHS